MFNAGGEWKMSGCCNSLLFLEFLDWQKLRRSCDATEAVEPRLLLRRLEFKLSESLAAVVAVMLLLGVLNLLLNRLLLLLLYSLLGGLCCAGDIRDAPSNLQQFSFSPRGFMTSARTLR